MLCLALSTRWSAACNVVGMAFTKASFPSRAYRGYTSLRLNHRLKAGPARCRLSTSKAIQYPTPSASGVPTRTDPISYPATAVRADTATQAEIPTQAATPSQASPQPLPIYTLPQAGLLAHLPASWVPYAELSRLDKPAGSIYLFMPCLFSTLLFAPLTLSSSPPSTLLTTTALFLTGALTMRGAGCTINDIWDRNLDPHVSRTRLRPIARRAVSVPAALVWFSAQSLLGLAVLVQFPPLCLLYGLPSMLLVATYPLAKRVTGYPQFVLGLAFSWGAIMGAPALGIDLLANTIAMAASAALYASCVTWTLSYDMIYAYQDLKDDKTVGIKSIARTHEHNAKPFLSALAMTQTALLAVAGYAIGAGPVYYLGTCGGAAATLAYTIAKVDLQSVQDCWWWFRNGCWITGGAISLGLLGEYLYQFSIPEGKKHASNKVQVT